MDFLTLTTFSTVARLGSVSAAALELNTVQSNVTVRIKQLESELGAPLFMRHSRGVSLTNAGARVLVYAQRFNALVADATAAVRDDGDVSGPLRIGSMETTAAVREYWVSRPVSWSELEMRSPELPAGRDGMWARITGKERGSFLEGHPFMLH